MSRQFPALRGLAILIVVLNHTIALTGTARENAGFAPAAGVEGILLLTLKQLGLFAVPIFLFLSGSFFVYTIQGQVSRLSFRVIWSGLKHVLWPYLFWTLVFYGIVFFTAGERLSLVAYIKNLISGYPYHFVPLLIFFYILSPLLVRVALRTPWLLLAVAGLYQLFIISVISPNAVGFRLPDWAWNFTPPVIRSPLAIWGIFFPLGIVYSLHSRKMLPYLMRMKWLILALTAFFFILSVLNSARFLFFPLADILSPVLAMFLLPLIKRESIPMVRQFERVGKKAFGLYLTHFITLTLIVFVIGKLIPQLLVYQVLLVPILFTLAMRIPLFIMESAERLPQRGAYRYVFG